MSEFYEIIARRVAVLFSPKTVGPGVQLHAGAYEDDAEEVVGGYMDITFPDGTEINGEYEIIGGEGKGYKILENDTPYSDEDAIKLLDAAEEEYWNGHNRISLDELLRQAGIV